MTEQAADLRTIALTTEPRSRGGAAEIACTLPTAALPARVDDWRRLLARATRREVIDGGLRITFGAGVSLVELAALVEAEQSCCRFFAFAITVDDRGVALEVTAPADAAEVVAELFG